MPLHAIVTAGGRLPAELHPHSDSRVKALLPVAEKTLLEHALYTLQESGIFSRIAVVGNTEVQEAVGDHAEHVAEQDSLVNNIHAAFEHLGGERSDYLVFSPDLPFVEPGGLSDFVNLARDVSGMGFPYVTKEVFLARFPDAPNKFEKISGMELTMGSCVYMSGPMLRTNIPLARDFYKSRKSPLKMAALLGLPIVFAFLTRSLSLQKLEQRASSLTGGVVKALEVGHAGLAFDIDDLVNYRHALEILAVEKKPDVTEAEDAAKKPPSE